MKKRISIWLFVISMIIICCLYLTKPSTPHISNENILYSKALDFVVSNHKNNAYNKDKEDYQIFTDYIPYGIEETNQYQYIFMWIHLESFYVLNNELFYDESFSIPYKITYKDNQVIQCQIPEDGSFYKDSIQKLFPIQIQNKIFNQTPSFDLSKQIQKHYAYLPSPETIRVACY